MLNTGYNILSKSGSIEAFVDEVRVIEIPVRDIKKGFFLLPMDIFIYGNVKSTHNEKYLYPGKTGYKAGDYTYIKYEKRGNKITHAYALKSGKVNDVEAVQPELVIPVDGIILSFMKK